MTWLALVAALLLPAGTWARVWNVAAHVHTSWSGGAHSPEEIGRLAARRGLDAVLLADHDLVRAAWGVPPFEYLLSYRVDRPSVVARGPESYLADVAAASRSTGVLLVPGAEVSAHARWAGAPPRLELRGWRRHLLLFGLSRARDWEELPVPGNRGRIVWDRLPWPWLAAAAAGAVLSLALASTAAGPGRRAAAAGLGLVDLLALGHLCLSPAYPWPTQGPAAERAGWAPYQAVIEHGLAAGALVVWAHPDAEPSDEWVSSGPVGAVLRDAPYPEALERTHGYHGFEALVAGPSPTAAPGATWDRVAERAAEAGASGPWGLAGQDLHQDGRSGRLGDLILRVEAPKPTWPALREALVAGRFTVLRRAPSQEAWLEEVAVEGDRVRIRIGGTPGLRVTVGLGGRRVPKPVSVVVPTELTLPVPAEGRTVRAWLRGPGPVRALSNPVPVPSSSRNRS